MVFSGKPYTEFDNRLADGMTRCKQEQIAEKPYEGCPGTAWQVQDWDRGSGASIMKHSKRVRGRIAASTKTTHEVNWRMWVSWRSFVVKECWLQAYMGGE